MGVRALHLSGSRRQHAEVPVGRAVKDDASADDEVHPCERQELRVDERRDALVSNRAACVGQIDEGRQPERPAQRIEPFSADVRQLALDLLVHPELGEQRHERGSPGAVASLSSSERPGGRGELGQSALLASDGEHLDAVAPGRFPTS